MEFHATALFFVFKCSLYTFWNLGDIFSTKISLFMFDEMIMNCRHPKSCLSIHWILFSGQCLSHQRIYWIIFFYNWNLQKKVSDINHSYSYTIIGYKMLCFNFSDLKCSHSGKFLFSKFSTYNNNDAFNLMHQNILCFMFINNIIIYHKKSLVSETVRKIQ